MNKEELIEQIKAGNKNAIKEFIRDYHPEMQAAVRKYTADDADVRMIEMNAFTKAIKEIDTLENAADIEAWLEKYAGEAASDAGQQASVKKHPARSAVILTVVIVLLAGGVFLYRHIQQSGKEDAFTAPPASSMAAAPEVPDVGTAAPLETTAVPQETASSSTLIPEVNHSEISEVSESSDYLLPDSSTKALADSDLAGMDAAALTYARNEIYARHGKIFKSGELNRYFQQKSWYHGDPDFSDSELSALELANAVFIRDYQKSNGLTYKPSDE